MKNCVLVLFFSFILCLSAKQLNAQSIVVKGVVVDKQSNLPIEFVSVALFKTKDSSVVAGSLTKKNGVFSIEKISADVYTLKLVALSYKPLFCPYK